MVFRFRKQVWKTRNSTNRTCLSQQLWLVVLVVADQKFVYSMLYTTPSWSYYEKNIHPTLNPVIFIDEDTKSEIVSKSTLTSDETREVDGVKYFIIRLDVTSFSHPFFTGEMRFVDRQGRVDKFIQKWKLLKQPRGKRRKLAKQADDGEDSKVIEKSCRNNRPPSESLVLLKQLNLLLPQQARPSASETTSSVPYSRCTIGKRVMNPYQAQIDQLEAKTGRRNRPPRSRTGRTSPSGAMELSTQIQQLQQAADQLLEAQTETTTTDSTQRTNCTMEFRPGTGGDEAKIWANDLLAHVCSVFRDHQFSGFLHWWNRD